MSLFSRIASMIFGAMLVVTTFESSAQADSTKKAFFCFFRCAATPPTGQEYRNVGDASTDNIFSNPTRGAQAANTLFKFYALQEQPEKTGYVKVAYSFAGRADPNNSNVTIYDDTSAEHNLMFERSLLDWAKSLFVTNNRTYLVTLTAKSTDTGQTFWVHPIIAFTATDSFSKVEINDKFRFNGDSTFYRKSRESIDITLEVRHTETNDLNIELIKGIFDSVGQLSALAGGPVFSVATAMANPAYSKLINDITAKVQKFEESKTLTRTATLKYEQGKWVGFEHYFRAPNELDYPPFILRVGLEFKKSLFGDFIEKNDGKSVLPSSAVLSSLVRPALSDGSNRTLDDYIATEGESKEVPKLVENPAGDLNSACVKFRESARKILEDRDIAFAMLAYFQHNAGFIKERKAPECFETSHKGYLKAEQLELPEPFRDAQSSTGTEIRALNLDLYFKRYMDSLLLVIKYGEEQREAVGTSIATLLEQAKDGNNERGLYIHDTSGLFITTGTLRRLIYPSGLVDLLLAKTFKHAGCYHQMVYSDAANPNVVGLIFTNGTDQFEAVVHFDQTPPANPAQAQIIVDEIKIRPLTAENLERYAVAWGRRQCMPQWTPWRIGGTN